MAVYKLKTPKTIDGETVAEIPVRELEVDQVIALAEIDTRDLKALRAFLAEAMGVSEELIGKLTMTDFKGLVEVAADPLAERPGATPSA